MAGEISVITGLSMEALPSPAAASTHHSGTQRNSAKVKSPAQSGIQAQPATGGMEAPAGGPEEGKKLLAYHLERAQKTMMTHNATFSFERDSEDGRMYLHVKDKMTGEDIYRIPKNYLRNAAPPVKSLHEVDVLI